MIRLRLIKRVDEGEIIPFGLSYRYSCNYCEDNRVKRLRLFLQLPTMFFIRSVWKDFDSNKLCIGVRMLVLRISVRQGVAKLGIRNDVRFQYNWKPVSEKCYDKAA